jgi:hypothetical protein
MTREQKNLNIVRLFDTDDLAAAYSRRQIVSQNAVLGIFLSRRTGLVSEMSCSLILYKERNSDNLNPISRRKASNYFLHPFSDPVFTESA